CHLRGRAVLEEVEDRERPAEDRERDAESRELLATEVADDRGVDEQVHRLRCERSQRRKRERDDLAVVAGAKPHVRPVPRAERRLLPKLQVVTCTEIGCGPSRERKLQVVTWAGPCVL